MAEFKVGDKVKFKGYRESSPLNPLTDGDIYTVSKVFEFSVKVEGSDILYSKGWFSLVENPENLKFKVGDKVKCVKQKGVIPHFDLEEGVVFEVYGVYHNAVALVGKGDLKYGDDRFTLYEEPLPVRVNNPPEEIKHPHYYKDFGAYLCQETGQVLVDVYAVLDEFKVEHPELQHLAKKVLCLGDRGHKDLATDLDNIIDSALRLKERLRLKEEYK